MTYLKGSEAVSKNPKNDTNMAKKQICVNCTKGFNIQDGLTRRLKVMDFLIYAVGGFENRLLLISCSRFL